MRYLKQILISLAVAIVAVVVVSFGYFYLSPSTGTTTVCSMPYALCTSAKCIPDPDHAGKTICFCDVLDGKSMGTIPCDKRTPYTDKQGAQHVTSTFSMEQFDVLKTMTCPEGTPWSDCLNQPCTIDPQDPSRAICSCKLLTSGPWQTFGGNCNRSTCKSGYWSGAPNADVTSGVEFMMRVLQLTQSPQKFCPE